MDIDNPLPSENEKTHRKGEPGASTLDITIQRLYGNRNYLSVREFILCSLNLVVTEGEWTEAQGCYFEAFEQLIEDYITPPSPPTYYPDDLPF